MAVTMLSFIFGIILSLFVIRNFTYEPGTASQTTIFGTLFFLGLCLAPPCYIPPNLFALRFGGKDKAGSLNGLIDGMAYIVAMAFDFGAGSLAASLGWASVIEVCIVAAILAFLSTMWYFHNEINTTQLSSPSFSIKTGISNKLT